MISKRHAALAVLGIVALTACGTAQENAAGDSSEQTQAAQQDSEAEASDNSEQQQLGDVTQSMDDALQTITYPMQNHEGEITMGVLAPEVQGDAMLVSIVFEPEFADETTEGIKFKDLHGSSANSVLMPVVSDRENFKAYHVPRETTNQFVQGGGWTGGSFATGTWASAIGNVEVRSGDQYVHWAYFPTPEDDIETVDIAVIPGMQEFRDVTIDWGSNEPASTTSSDASQDD